jgi:hypothetical protein
LRFEDAWLEVRACTGGQDAASASEKMLAVPAISEVLEAAANANRHLGMWDYSRRLYPGEMEAIKGAISLAKTAEDSRSVSLVANIAYKGSCYTLTLFAIKERSQ